MTMSLAQEIGQNRGRGRVRPNYAYYRQPNGWVTASPASDSDELKYRRDGWEPLFRYGRFDMGSEWAADHPLEALFMRGGAGELPRQQVLEMGLALVPPQIPGCLTPLTADHPRHTGVCRAEMLTVRFPQLDGLEADLLGPFDCRFCGVQKPTVKARDQHETVMHKDEKSDLRSGEVLAGALIAGLRPPAQEAQPDPVVAVLLGQMAELRAELAALKAAKK